MLGKMHNRFFYWLVNYFHLQNIFVWKNDTITILMEMILNKFHDTRKYKIYLYPQVSYKETFPIFGL